MSSAPPRQDQARPAQHHSCIEERKGYNRGHIPRLCLPKELRNSCGARQGKAESCLRQNYIDMLVCFLRFMQRERGATEGEIGLVLLLSVVIFMQWRSYTRKHSIGGLACPKRAS